MNFRDAIFLKLLYSNNAKTKLTSMTLKDIISQSNKHLVISGSLRVRVANMIEDGYIAEGLSYGHSKSYYITPKGINWLNEMSE